MKLWILVPDKGVQTVSIINFPCSASSSVSPEHISIYLYLSFYTATDFPDLLFLCRNKNQDYAYFRFFMLVFHYISCSLAFSSNFLQFSLRLLQRIQFASMFILVSLQSSLRYQVLYKTMALITEVTVPTKLILRDSMFN